MAFLPSEISQASLLDLIVERLRKTKMSDWIKIGLTLAGFGIVMWSSIQNLEYRVDKIENTLEQHLDKHEAQYSDIQKTLKDIQIELTRMQK